MRKRLSSWRRWAGGANGACADLDLHFVELHERLELRLALLLRAAVLAAVVAIGRSCSAQPFVEARGLVRQQDSFSM